MADRPFFPRYLRFEGCQSASAAGSDCRAGLAADALYLLNSRGRYY